MMTSRLNRTRTGLISLCLLASGSALGGGPLVLEGSNGNTPVSYPGGSVTLHFDQGAFSTTLSNQQADDAVNAAFALWNGIASAALDIRQGADLSADIDKNNYSSLLPSGADNDPSLSDNLNPLIYDADGRIIDDYLGTGASGSTAGFAASIYSGCGSQFIEGYAVLNGKLLDSSSKATKLAAHEIGHLIGLDHSQLDIAGSNPATCTPSDDYPLMYPYLCRLTATLHPDDEAAASALYPAADIDQQLGQLRGTFVDTAGQPILGANLWVVNQDTGDKYSIVSDYLKQGTGFFSLYLPAGNYTLHANSIDPLFTDASSVGPYAVVTPPPKPGECAIASDALSFQSPHPITPVTYQRDTGTPVAVTVSTGSANEVTFRVDGSGTDTGGLAITAPVSGGATGGGGGQLTLSWLLLCLLLPGLRRLRLSVFARR